MGGIRLQGKQLHISDEIKILGLKIKHPINFNRHAESIAHRANIHLKKLYRFKHCSVKIKRHLFLALIQPILDYPSFALHNSGSKNKSKLQRVLNKGLRLIFNVKVSDRISCKTLHENAKFDPMNVRLAKLTKRILYKMKDIYLDYGDNYDPPSNKMIIDYMNANPPIKERKRSLPQFVLQTIFSHVFDRQGILQAIPNNMEHFGIPNPKYTVK